MEPVTIERWLITEVARELGKDAAVIDPTARLTDQGVDVQSAVSLARGLERYANVKLAPAVAWDCPTIRELAQHVASLASTSEQREGENAVSTSSSGWTAADLRRHYNIGEDFYRLWLDDNLVYSSALWTDGEDTLEQAQLRKLDFHVEGARAAGKRNVLDIGCGWGTLLSRLIKQHGVERAVGLTQSEVQAAHIRAWGEPKIEVHLQHWSRYQPESRFDAIIAIGPLEYFSAYAANGERVRDKVTAYRAYFRRCHELLNPGSAMTLQTVVKGNSAIDREAAHELAWLYTEMFPGVDFPRFSEVVAASEGLFEITAVRIDRSHYVRTMRAWHERLLANRTAAVDLVGEAMVAKYEKYFVLATRQFAAERFSSLRFVLNRVDTPA